MSTSTSTPRPCPFSRPRCTNSMPGTRHRPMARAREPHVLHFTGYTLLYFTVFGACARGRRRPAAPSRWPPIGQPDQGPGVGSVPVGARVLLTLLRAQGVRACHAYSVHGRQSRAQCESRVVNCVCPPRDNIGPQPAYTERATALFPFFPFPPPPLGLSMQSGPVRGKEKAEQGARTPSVPAPPVSRAALARASKARLVSTRFTSVITPPACRSVVPLESRGGA